MMRTITIASLLIVADLEHSLKFYVDVDGVEVYSVDPYCNRDPKSLGYGLFDVSPGARKRMAMLNTSDEHWAAARQAYRGIVGQAP